MEHELTGKIYGWPLFRIVLTLLIPSLFFLVGCSKYSPSAIPNKLLIEQKSEVAQLPTEITITEPDVAATKTPAYTLKYRQNSEDQSQMVYVMGGEYMMGNKYYVEEKPIHPVYVDSFWLYQMEVTNQQYAHFLNESGNQKAGDVSWLFVDNEIERIHIIDDEWQADDGYEDHPVVVVT